MFPKNRTPTHPGVILQEEFLKPMKLDATRFAEVLGGHWSEIKVNAILRGTELISDFTAHEFADALGTTVEFWKRVSRLYHQWQIEQQQHEKGHEHPWKHAQ